MAQAALPSLDEDQPKMSYNGSETFPKVVWSGDEGITPPARSTEPLTITTRLGNFGNCSPTPQSTGGTYLMQSNGVIGPTSTQTQQALLHPMNNNPPARNPPRQWRMANVISTDHKRYLTNLYLNRELDRLASFCRWPTGCPNVAPVALAKAGFFYLGDMDRTQCFSCGGVLRNWSANDDAMIEHRTHFPNCRLMAGIERRNVPIGEEAETPMELAEKYPCRFPMNPHMRSEAARLATFYRTWPAERTRATRQKIAEAGFFFLGERDRVKCWYCNGGLRNWEYNDVPWIEHAKWFPSCQFLLAMKGQKFVHTVLSQSPHLPWPVIGRQDGASEDPFPATVHEGAQDVSQPPASRDRVPSPPSAIIDHQEELCKRRERVEKEMKEKDMVKLILAMGFGENLVRRTLLDRLESSCPHDIDDIYESAAALLDAVMEKETELKREEEPATSNSFQASSFRFDRDNEDGDLYSGIDSSFGAIGDHGRSGSASAEYEAGQPLLDQDRELSQQAAASMKEEGLCRMCHSGRWDSCFVPCCHMVHILRCHTVHIPCCHMVHNMSCTRLGQHCSHHKDQG